MHFHDNLNNKKLEEKIVPKPVLWIRVRTDPHHLAGSRISDADLDPRLQNWHLVNHFSKKVL
jgi:hypothetical protein